ncbi:MAG: PEP-CTERM sorting domain-containing protein [Gemmatimonadaceae bacterium]|nr:PEP-CTERM sorting domain-containing protein [Gemmatimonadaceae bacterium]
MSARSQMRSGRANFARPLVSRLRVSAFIAAVLIVAPSAQSQTFDTFFGASTGGGFTCAHPTNPAYCANVSNFRPAPLILTVGDFWNQTINNSALASVSTLTLNLNLANVLFGASSMQFSVLLNGTLVGSTPTYGTTGGFDINTPLVFSFAAISAATYDVRVQVSAASVPPGETQAMGLYTDGPSTIQLATSTITTPEPGTWALLGAGLFGVGIFSRRRTRAR